MSLLHWPYFIRYINGKTLPWLNGQQLFFPSADKYKPACYIPMRGDISSTRDHGCEITFKRTRGGSNKMRVFGIAEIPLFIGGVPLRISCLLVDSLPLHRTEHNVEVPNMLILGSFLNGRTVPLRYHNNLIQTPKATLPPTAIINTCVLPETGNIALEVYADVANPKCHKRASHHDQSGRTVTRVVYDYGYGVWFGEDSIFNTSGTMELGQPKPDYILELRGALQVLYAIRDLCLYNYSSFDFTDVIIYSSSKHIVDWVNVWEQNWEVKGWVDSLKLESRAKNLWDEIMNNQKIARKTFHWKYLDPKNNEEPIALARQAIMGMKSNLWEPVTEAYNYSQLKMLLKPKQRPVRYTEGLSLEGGMCRKKAPKGFTIDTCCQCHSGKKEWGKYFHF
ncbi:hypothetical protein AA313_de0207284 [Arthrobotrys entomopaga]|nr:hypothetical protein AA313_de0207284 [Arthrobotrys entomopaga]